MVDRLEKNRRIAEKGKATRLKRHSQKCRVFQLKINERKLNKLQKENLQRMFLEAKWLYNYCVTQEKLDFNFYKLKTVTGLDRDKNIIVRQLPTLYGKIKQGIIQQIFSNIKMLSTKKKQGKKIGRLKPKSEYNGIELNQNLYTHKIIDSKRIKIAGIKKPLFVHGLHQIKKDYEIANAKLIRKPSGYYIYITTYENLRGEPKNKKKNDIGLDFGIKTHIATSEGKKYTCTIEETDRLKRLQRKFSKQKKRSNNKYKTLQKIKLEYEKISNRKNDASNKIVSELLRNYNFIYFQDENISGWQKAFFGKQVQHSILGRVKFKLRQSKKTLMLDRFLPTTKFCFNCGKENKLELSDRIFNCECGYSEDRDIKAAKTMVFFGHCHFEKIGMERTEFTPVEKVSDSELVSTNSGQFSEKQEASINS